MIIDNGKGSRSNKSNRRSSAFKYIREKKIRNLNIAVRAKNGKLINVYGNANERNLE